MVRRVLSSLLLSAGVWAAAFQDGSHCVAYEVRKTMFLLKTDTVVGRNCDISAQVLPEVGGLFHIEVNIPVKSFDSGDVDRDKDVLKILKGEQRPEITFRSVTLTAADWQKNFAKGSFPLDGQLYIGPASYPVTLNVSYAETDTQAEVRGRARVKFSDFAMVPPKVAGGLIAKSKPEFDLFFNLVSTRILGADSIRLPQQKKEKL